MATKQAPPPEELPQVPTVAETDYAALLRNAGWLAPAGGGSDFNRLKISGSNVFFAGEIIASYNAKTKEPAMYVQIAGPLAEYQAMWFDEEGNLGRAVNRPDFRKKFCKSHFDVPGEDRKFSEDRTDCNTCPVHPFMPKDQLPPEADGKRCAWKADIDLYILDKQPDGTLVRTDETLYTLTLATTGVIEFKGSSSKKAGSGLAGSVSEHNTMVKLAKLAVEKWGEEGLLKGLTYFNLGLGIFELRLIPQTTRDKSKDYTVPSFTPIDIIEPEEQPALPTSGEAENEDVPF